MGTRTLLNVSPKPRLRAIDEGTDDGVFPRPRCVGGRRPGPARGGEEPRALRLERANSGGEKYPILPLTREISCRCIKGRQKYV